MASLAPSLAEDITVALDTFKRLGLRMAAAPRRASARQLAITIVVGAAALCAYAYRWPLQRCVQSFGDGPARTAASLANACGSGASVTALGFALFVVGRWRHKRAMVDAALALAAAGLWCWVFTETGQLLFAETRPNQGGALHFVALGGHGVSGHASAAGLLYGPAHEILARDADAGVRRAVQLAAIAWALFIGWSRVWLGMHFVWNVVLGLAIGFATGLAGSRQISSQTADPAPFAR